MLFLTSPAASSTLSCASAQTTSTSSLTFSSPVGFGQWEGLATQGEKKVVDFDPHGMALSFSQRCLPQAAILSRFFSPV